MSFGDMKKEQEAFMHPSVKRSMDLSSELLNMKDDEIIKLKKQLEEAENVIEFYADKQWHLELEIDFFSGASVNKEKSGSIINDGGKRAREYRAKCSKENK